MSDQLEQVLEELGVASFVRAASDAALGRSLAATVTPATRQPEPDRLPRLAFIYETQALKKYADWSPTRKREARKPMEDDFLRGFACWTGLASLPETDGSIARGISKRGDRLVRDALLGDLVPPDLILPFHHAVTGLAAGRTAETRLELRRYAVERSAHPQQWGEHVAHEVFRAFVLLTRKANGWTEVRDAIDSLNRLRDMQGPNEKEWLDSQGPQKDVQAASLLVGLYHLAQMVTLAGDYLVGARGARTGVARLTGRLDLHYRRAETALRAAGNPVAQHSASLLWLGTKELVQNSIWTQIEGLGPHVLGLAEQIAQREDNPVIELWPAQQDALRQGLLDAYARAILIEMPTSAGKTLLAKFAMIQTHALAQGTIAYVVPTRALVNQVTVELRQDFRKLNISVEQAVPAFEMDPAEDRLLSDAPGVLVTTPEKLDFLVRKDHPVTANLTMVIADEAHNLGDRTRGARLELLLGMLKRDRAGIRFLLLSPFVPQSDDLLPWLGEDRAHPAIRINWRPSRRIVGAFLGKGAGKSRRLTFETLPASDNADTQAGLTLPLSDAPPTRELSTLRNIVHESVAALSRRGGVLVLCRGPGTSVTRARELAAVLPEAPPTPELATVSRYLEAEWGGRPALAEYMRHGVAYHHAGLSNEARWLIEGLIRRRQIKVICGTTTLAQGVNFPISTVIVESLDKGNDVLTYADFWNIAGRAGRTLIDPVGIVGFPTPSKAKKKLWTEFLEGEAEAISSQLAVLIDRVDEIGERFDLNVLFKIPQLSPLLQFLAHAMRVAGSSDFATQVDELEELLRASLVFHQVRTSRGDAAVQKLVELCRRYLGAVRKIPSGTLVLADQTGFATPSVLQLLVRKNENKDFSDARAWEPASLFGTSVDPLARRIDAIAQLPEMQLGRGDDAPFSARRVAAILKDWVSGVSLETMARRYATLEEGKAFDKDRDTADFSRYLFSALIGRASWGLGALEGICLAGQPDDVWNKVGYVPSMVYFGVQEREAVWLRMVGVPRVVAEGLGRVWRDDNRQEPASFEELRSWVGALDDSRWKKTIPKDSNLTTADMRWIWKEFAG